MKRLKITEKNMYAIMGYINTWCQNHAACKSLVESIQTHEVKYVTFYDSFCESVSDEVRETKTFALRGNRPLMTFNGAECAYWTTLRENDYVSIERDKLTLHVQSIDIKRNQNDTQGKKKRVAIHVEYPFKDVVFVGKS